MVALLLQLGGDAWFGSAQVDAEEVEDVDCESTQSTSYDSDTFEDAASFAVTLEPAAAIASTIEREPAATWRLHPGYAASLERPPDPMA